MSFFPWFKFIHFHQLQLLPIIFFLRNMATAYTIVVNSGHNTVVPSKASSYLRMLSVSEVSVLGKLTNNFYHC